MDLKNRLAKKALFGGLIGFTGLISLESCKNYEPLCPAYAYNENKESEKDANYASNKNFKQEIFNQACPFALIEMKGGYNR